MTYRDIARRLVALEQLATEDTAPADLLAPRVVDYRTVLDPTAPQTGPIVIWWVDYAGPLGDEGD